eukprot:6198490-Pleurochrysis_carterae.AAC.3
MGVRAAVCCAGVHRDKFMSVAPFLATHQNQCSTLARSKHVRLLATGSPVSWLIFTKVRSRNCRTVCLTHACQPFGRADSPDSQAGFQNSRDCQHSRHEGIIESRLLKAGRVRFPNMYHQSYTIRRIHRVPQITRVSFPPNLLRCKGAAMLSTSTSRQEENGAYTRCKLVTCVFFGRC